MSLESVIGQAAKELLEHEEVIALAIDAIKNRGVTSRALVDAIKAEITKAGADALRAEFSR
jgi:hypothetical protein